MADWKKRGGVKAKDSDKVVVQWLLLGRRKHPPFLALYSLYLEMHQWSVNYRDKNGKSSGNRGEGHLIDTYEEMFAFHCLVYRSMCA